MYIIKDNRSQLTLLKIILFLFLLITYISNPSLASEDTNQLITQNVEFKNKSLGEVFKKLSEVSGYNIKIEDHWKAYHVSASLKGVTVENAIKRILKNLDHAVLYHKKNIYIKIVGLPPSNALSTLGPKKSPTGIVTPPIDALKRGLTQSELDAITERQAKYSPSPDEIITPPFEDGRPGLTQRELDQITKNQNKKSSKEIITPPLGNGKPGLTSSQLNAITNAQQKDSQDAIVTPPIKKGTSGMTQKALNNLWEKQMADRKKNMTDPDKIVTPPIDELGRGLTLRELKEIDKLQKKK